MTTEHYLQKERRRIDRYLRDILPPKGSPPAQFTESLHYAVFSGGKRLRPIILLHISHLLSGASQRALPAAATVELIHTFSLIQDDLPAMDNDDLRRGKPTLHRAYDEYTALLASDYLLILAFRILAENYPAAATSETATALGLDGLVVGQYLDLVWQGRHPNQKVIEEIRLKKTAALFRLVFYLAGLIAEEPKEKIALLSEYGLLFGLAFQVRDDLADRETLESSAAMKRRLVSLVRRLQRLETTLHLSSPLLSSFHTFLLSPSSDLSLSA